MPYLNAVRRRILAAAAALALPALAWGQGYPDKPIKLVVPFEAGGGTDIVARDLAHDLSTQLHQAVIVENRGGAGGSVGASFVAHAAPDGYTLLFNTSTFATNAATQPPAAYDPEKSFVPIAMLGRGPLLVVANKSLGVKSVAELIALAKSKPGAINFCSAGIGSINHLAGELFKQRTHVDMTHVPYKGSNPATVDFLAGRTQVFFATVPTILPQVKNGNVQLLAVTSKERSKLFPNTPTMAQAGVADYDVGTWWGVMAPAGTPADVVAKINAAVNTAVQKGAVRKRLLDEGADIYQGTPADFTRILAQELATWRSVVGQPGIKLN